MRALILSAGLGERLRPLTLKRAKPAIEFLNLPMLAFPYYWLDTLDLKEVVFNTHYLPDSIRHAAMKVVKPVTQLHFTHENEILGSGGGLWNARFHLQDQEHFAVANGDAVVTFAQVDVMEQMLHAHRRSGALATMLVCPLEGVGHTIPGVWIDPHDEVVNFGKAPLREGLRCLHYASFMVISKRIWQYLPAGSSNILYDVYMSAIAQGEVVRAFEVSDMRWFETGNAADYLSATRHCLESLRDQSEQGLQLLRMLSELAPAFERRSDLAQLQLIADHAQIEDRAQLRGMCVIGPDSKVPAQAQVENSVILPGAEIKPHEFVRNEIRA